jgi:genome maintenance exonuclease 1
MTLIERQAPSHWYLRDGRPFHEIAKKDGSGNRAVTLADARKCLALPSVTNILGVLAKPGLDAWKIEQGIMAALTLPRLTDEPLDVFARRVVTDMGEQVEKAADFGTAIHSACEVYALNKELPSDPKLLEHLKDWQRWFDGNVERIDSIEQVFVHLEHGYAGRVDMIAKLKGIGWAVVDFKTQKIKRSVKGEPKPAFYETWPLQLAAYQQAALAFSGKNITALVSVVIDSSMPGPVHVKVYENPAEYFKMFLAATTLWRFVKGYDPTIQIPPCSRQDLN